MLTGSAVQRLRSRLTGCTRCRRTRARGPSARIAQRSIAYARETRRSGSNLGRERGRGRAAERGGRKGETTSCPMDGSAACLFVHRSLRPITGPSTSTVHCTALAERHSTKRGKAISGRKRRNASFPPPTTTTDDGDVGQRENGREQKDPLGRGRGGEERRGGEGSERSTSKKELLLRPWQRISSSGGSEEGTSSVHPSAHRTTKMIGRSRIQGKARRGPTRLQDV